MQGRVGQVVTVFRSRLRPGVEAEYGPDAARMSELARRMPGHVDHTTFVSDDGERVTVVTFADEATWRAWREHPEHREAQRRGAERYYAEWSVQSGTTTSAGSSVTGWSRR